MQGLTWGDGHLCPLLLSGLLDSACGDGFIQSEVLLPQKVFGRVSVQEAFHDLVSDVLPSAVVQTEFASLGQLPKTYQEVVKCFSRLLDAAVKCPSLYRVVNVAFHVALNSCYYLCHAASLLVVKAEVLNDGHSLMREAQGKGLYLLGGRLCVEPGEAYVGVPLCLPRLEVRSSVDL